jgi:methylated-DNA-[protein]-cysteine S-methyltransferase
MFTQTYHSPIGILTLYANAEALTAIVFDERQPKEDDNTLILQVAITELEAYFAGKLKQFSVPLQPKGTAFQLKVWEALQQIAWGQVNSYSQLATQLGDIKAIRAVGTANGRNPIPIIIPCHRVIGSTGELVGYSGGLWRKEWLLQHEGLRAKNIFGV